MASFGELRNGKLRFGFAMQARQSMERFVLVSFGEERLVKAGLAWQVKAWNVKYRLVTEWIGWEWQARQDMVR